MNLATSTILVTGGATGIGFGLVERFVATGAQVIICGRREDALRRAQERLPALRWIVADVSREADRVALVERALREAPALNVLVNNAGVQRRTRVLEDRAPWAERASEIAINFEAPLHLTSLLLPHLTKQRNAAIVNVSSALALIPAAFAPVYSATKAALHSLTVALRHELAPKNIEVVEVLPPAVDTDLGGVGVHANATPVATFVDAVMAGIAQGKKEIAYGLAERALTGSRVELEAMGARMGGS